MKNVLITVIKSEFDKELAVVFEREGYRVYSANDEIPENKIDIYIDTTDVRSDADTFNVRTGLNEKVIKKLYEANVIQPMALFEKYFPLLEEGEGKRLCFITSKDASINETCDTNGYGYKMAKAALHNFLQITRNVLAPKGYSIRAFDPCQYREQRAESREQIFEVTPKQACLTTSVASSQAAEAACNYFTRRRGMERDDPNRDDEGNLVLRDAFGRQHSW